MDRVEELPVLGRATTAWSAMQKHHRQTTGVATLLKIDTVAVQRRQKAVLIGFDGRIQSRGMVCGHALILFVLLFMTCRQ
jgi:hypothetical protein